MIVLDGKKFVERDKSFNYLNEMIDFEYEVRNLDSLYDNLSIEEIDIEIINYKDIVENLGDYGRRLLKVFIDCYINCDIKLNLIAFEGDKNV